MFWKIIEVLNKFKLQAIYSTTNVIVGNIAIAARVAKYQWRNPD